jgi:MOSC domain-containing protein YiiM
MGSEAAGTIVSVNVSEKTGVKKCNVGNCLAVVGHGLEGDAHAGEWHRQISLLAVESIDKMRLKGLDVWPGDFAENLTTQGIELVSLPVGTRLDVGDAVILEVTQIGKECHKPCAIYYEAGGCVMPKEGIFTRVIEGGDIAVGDDVTMEDIPGGSA